MSKFKFFEESNSLSFANKNANTANVIENSLQDKATGFQKEVSARYRCEQFNTTKVEDHINFHCNVKKQYLLELKSASKASVLLEQYLYKTNPEDLAGAMAATEELEYYKENVAFSLNSDKTIGGIDNWMEVKSKWELFKPKMRETELYKMIGRSNTSAAEDLIKGGDMEFGSEENMLKSYEKSLFYHMIFSDYDPLIDRDAKQVLTFSSQIFLNIPIELELTHGVINETELTTEIMTVGKLKRDKLDNSVLIEQYNKFYKPIIEYNFTEYNYEYVVRRTINNSSNLLISANAKIIEAVKYNYQFLTQFDLKKID